VDAYLVAPVSKSVKLTAGFDYRNSQTDQDFLSVSSFGNYQSAYSSDSLLQHQLGFYAALNLSNTKGFNLELGNRLNFHSEYGSNYVFNVNPSFLLHNKIKLFANLSSGYRTPSLYQLFSEFGNSNLQPESAITAEGGIQYFSPDNKWNGRLTLFGRNVKDIIFFYFNPITFQSQYINQDKQKDHGVEMELAYQPAKNILLKAFYSFVDGHITTKQNGKDTTYFNLLRRPRHSVGFNAGVNMTDRLFISSNFSWFDKRKDAYFDLQTFQTVNVTLDSYVLWDIYTEYSLFKTKSGNYRIKVFLNLRNITDSHYREIEGYNTLRFNGYGGIRFGF
jgi:vitamin B12 transporter